MEKRLKYSEELKNQIRLSLKMGRMKILLVDVDSKIPNLALMKISNYYRNKGLDIELKRLGFDYYPKKKVKQIIDGSGYDAIFISVVFTTNKDVFEVINNKNVYIGGTGHKITKKLPMEIDNEECDYSIYPDNNMSYGFITRGCIRNCPFCFVPKKEGMIYKDREVDQVVKHKKVIFMDNNILAHPDHKKILQELIDKKVRCQFNQGLDIRLIDEENIKLLSQLKYMGEYIFAFDDIHYEKLIESKIPLIKKYLSKDWKLKFYIYVNPNMDIKNDVIYRVEWCRKNKALPYIMRDLSCWDSKNKDFYIDLAAYCNQPNLFKKLDFKQFIKKRTNNKDRQKKSVELYGL